MSKQLRVTTVGGGTGTFAMVSALKQLPVSISCVVAVSDSGGSTGRIRDEFGFLSVGDLRQSLAALADDSSQEWIKKILLYRFSKGAGLSGHNLGNLILTALQDMTSSSTQALEIAQKVFKLRGRVLPVTETAVDLVISYANGEQRVGEDQLNEHLTNQPPTITRVHLQPDCRLAESAREALIETDYIIIGPGGYYSSLMAALVVPGMAETLQRTQAKVVYSTNLMTRFTQTHSMTAAQHRQGIESTIGRPVDIVLMNNQPIPAPVLTHYATEHEFPVVDDLPQNDSHVVRAPLLSTNLFTPNQVDTVYRSLLRHDPQSLVAVLKQILHL